MTAARLALLAVSACLLASALPVAADEGRLSAGAVQYDSPAAQSGEMGLMFLVDAAVNPELTGGTRPWIDLEASAIAAVEYQDTTLMATAGPLSPAGPDMDPQTKPRGFGQAMAHLSEFQPGFQVHIYPLEGTIPYTMESSGGVFRAAPEARMGPGAFGDQVVNGEPPEAEPRTFAKVERPGPWAIHAETAPKVAVTLQGDFVVELYGISLQVEEQGRTEQLRSGAWRSPVDPSAPPQSADAVSYETRSFLRLRLTGAVLELATESGDPNLLWASKDVSIDVSERAVLVDANGEVETDDGDVPLRHERHVLPEGSRLLLTAQDKALTVDVAPSPVGPNGGTLATVAAPASAALIGTGAVLALGIAVGIGVLRRLLRLPALADVETAIEEGEYRKAARLAARILSRLPGSEEALLGRAIALSKSGQHQAVVAELTRHLALRPASDGTLHYVLGLSQLEAGREDDGKASLREAVRLTPSLQAEVAPRLGKAFSVATPTTRETNGYA